MRPLAKRSRYHPADTIPAPIVPEVIPPPTQDLSTVDLDQLVRGLLNVPTAERSTWLSRWRERVALEHNKKVARAWDALLLNLRSIIVHAADLQGARLELEARVARARLDLQNLELEGKVTKATLEADLAEQRRRKRRAENPEDD